LYAKTTSFFAENKERAAKLRGETLRAIEEGKGEDAELAQVVADAIVGFATCGQWAAGYRYELLARESEILHLHFWDAAFRDAEEIGCDPVGSQRKMAVAG